MRVMLNQRIWRHARRSSAATGAAVARTLAPYSAAVAVQLPASDSSRGLHNSARRCWPTSPLTPLLALRQASLRERYTQPLLLGASLHARSVFSAADEPGLFESEKDEPTEPVAEEEAAQLELLERAYKGEKNWHVGEDILDSIKTANGAGMTANIATALIDLFAVRQRPLECLETLRYAREIGVRPRIHAYSTTIACCYKDLKYPQALRVFEIMRRDGYVPQQVTYSRALSAALKASQHELVLEIFDDMLRNRIEPSIVTYNSILNSCARNGDVHSAMGVLRAVRQRGLEMTQSSYHSLAICGAKTGRWELARDAFTWLKESGFKPAMNIYNSVISAYAKGRRWSDIIAVYDEMPQGMRDMLHNTYLGAVIMAFAKSEDPQQRRMAIELFEQRRANGKEQDLNLFAYNAILLCHLKANELDKVHALAKEMKEMGLEWDGLTYQNLICAHVRAGNAQTAQQMLDKHGKHMSWSTVSYRELIQYYADEKQDYLAGCRLAMQMMQHNPRLSRQDWTTALSMALKSGNLAIYWNFRKWMKVRASMIIKDMPKELMLPDLEEEAQIKKQVLTQLQPAKKPNHKRHKQKQKEKPKAAPEPHEVTA